jgi:molybdate transport system substrate-binding protein
MNVRSLATAVRLVMIGVIALGAAVSSARAQQPDLLVFAAASLKTALDEINTQFQRDTGTKANTSYAASPALAKQIESGAPADVFISADLDWMDYLAQRRLINGDTRHNLASNAIVLIAPKSSAAQLKIAPNFALAQALGDGRLAMADPASVPAGKYGKASLEALGVWATVAAKVAPAENVRAALLLVSRGEAPLGIVYETDAAVDPGVRIVDRFPPNTHPPIVYPIAVTRDAKNPAAAAYVAYLRSAVARPALRKQGFTTLD